MRRTRSWLQRLVKEGVAEVSSETRTTACVVFTTKDGRKLTVTVWFVD